MSKKNHVIIIGLGLNGSCVANELVKKKFKVTAIDSGEFLNIDFFNKSWIKSDFSKIKSSLSIIKSFILNSKISDFTNPVTHRVSSLIQSKNLSIISSGKNKFETYGINKVGGRSHIWGRVAPRSPKSDFGNLKKWPFKYKNITNFYREIESKFKLSGLKNKQLDLFNGNYIKKKKFNKLEKLFLDEVKKKWRFRSSNVLPTLDYTPGPLNPMLKEIIHNKNFEIIKNTIVKKIITNKDGVAEAIETINKKSKKKTILYSDFIFISASPLETIKILLNSKSKKFVNGIGNTTKLLGKKFFDHIGIAYNSLIKTKLNIHSKKKFNPLHPNKNTNGFYFLPFRDKEIKNKFILKYSIHGTIDTERNILSIYSFSDAPKINTNYITLDKYKKDKYGVPLPKINFKWAKEQVLTWKDQKKTMIELVKILNRKFNLNLYQTESNFKIFNKLPNGGFSHHESGGAIMGTNKHNSVVNQYGKIWDCHNVFICDQSVFPFLSFVNPTLTSMAISLRSARNFANKY